MVTGDELAGGGIANPTLLRRRGHAVVTGWKPAFHRAEYDHAAMSHHKVDFAASRPVLPGQKPGTRADKSGKRGKFGNPAGTFGLPAISLCLSHHRPALAPRDRHGCAAARSPRRRLPPRLAVSGRRARREACH